MLRLTTDGTAEFFWYSEANHEAMFALGPEEILLLAKQSRTISEFRLLLLTETRGILTDACREGRQATRFAAKVKGAAA